MNSLSLSLNTIVVFPAASSPTIKIRRGTPPPNELKKPAILDQKEPIIKRIEKKKDSKETGSCLVHWTANGMFFGCHDLHRISQNYPRHEMGVDLT